MKRNRVAARLEPEMDYYIESGDGDDQTGLLIDALAEIDRLQDALNRVLGQPTDFSFFACGYPPLSATRGYD